MDLDQSFPGKGTEQMARPVPRKRHSHTGAGIVLELSAEDIGSRSIQEALSAPAAGIPIRGGKVFNRDDWMPIAGEETKSYFWRLMTEGHTVPDAFMTCACAQIGQIMLTAPNALYKMGLISGCISIVFFLFCGYWTIYQFMALYLEMKRRMVIDGTWWETDGKHVVVVQYFNVVGFFLGKWVKMSAVAIYVAVIIGVLMTQINACSNNMYFVDPSRTKREWSLIYGGTMVFTMIFFPRFNHFRLANIVGLVTVACMATFIIIVASEKGVDYGSVQRWAQTSQDWFNGASIWLTILGTHSVAFEILESMEEPAHFRKSFSAAWIWAIVMTVPHSILCNLVYGQLFQALGAGADNIFSMLGASSLQDLILRKPASQAKYALAIMMNLHQFIAFAIYGTSLCFVWEKLIGVHDQPWYIKMPFRIPLGGLVWFLAVLAPFYGAINALYASVAIPYLGFVLPCICMLWFFKTRAQLEVSVLTPYSWVMWAPAKIAAKLEEVHPRLGIIVTPWFVVNVSLLLIYSGFGGTATYYAVLLVIQYYQTFGAFAECYACPPPPPAPAPHANVTGL